MSIYPVSDNNDKLPEYISIALRNAGYSKRQYQAKASLDAIRLLLSGKNVEINLPPGTGKTLISQIISSIWIMESEPIFKKVLCIVPSSTLREQHFRYSWWAQESHLCSSLEITPDWLNCKSSPHWNKFEESNFWFAMPESFCNAYDSGYIPYSSLDEVGLVIIDEYDAFSIGVLRAEGYSLRFTKDYERLLNILKCVNRKYLLTSATPAMNPSN